MVLLAACGGSSAAADPDPTMAMSPIVSANSSGTAVPSDGSTASTSSIATTTTLPARPQGEVTMAFSGDILIHSSVWEDAAANAGGTGYDFAPMFAEITPLVSSVDLGVCHLEVPIAPAGKQPSTFPLYGAPKELVAGIHSAGYDRCSNASNHSLDQGVAGIDATLGALDEMGMGHAGMARTPDEIEPKVFAVNGVTMAHLSYTWGYNGLDTPKGESWRSALNNPKRIISDAKKAREMGAQFVVVSMHWGTEPLAEVTSAQRKLAAELTASGQIDLIVGHHSHMIQKIEQVNGVWVVFGMGDSLSDLPTRAYFPPATQDGVVVLITMRLDSATGKPVVAAPVVHPTWVDKNNGHVIHDVLQQLARTDLSAGQRATYTESLRRTSLQVGDYITPH